MNLLEAFTGRFKNDWTGGASGDPGRYHAPGAFKDFRIADLFNNDRWTREPMVDPNSASGFLMNRDGITPRYTNYYNPRGGASAAPANAVPTAAAAAAATPVNVASTTVGSAINNDPLVRELAEKFRNDEWRGRGPQTIFPVDPVETQFDPTPLHVDQDQTATLEEKPPWWNQVGEFLGTAWEGAKNLPDHVPNLATSRPITSTLSPETRATEALEYKHLPADTQQLLFMLGAGIGRKGPVDYRELGLRRNDLSRSWRGGGVTPRNWGGG